MSRCTPLVFFSRFLTIPSWRFCLTDGAFSFNFVMPLSYEWRYTKIPFYAKFLRQKQLNLLRSDSSTALLKEILHDFA